MVLVLSVETLRITCNDDYSLMLAGGVKESVILFHNDLGDEWLYVTALLTALLSLTELGDILAKKSLCLVET